MTEPQPAQHPGERGGRAVPRRPASLIFEPQDAVTDPEHFFGLEALDDPLDLLARSTDLALAFRAATDRAVEYQALAAAQLADPRRFDRLTAEAIAERADWSVDYAQRMIDYGRDLLRGGEPPVED
ncbi:hypothetical protein SRB5_40740 [Streptomyces sp. RB5]|uniref:Uncharacterized protein n=1 Tax=Streptomyces smaragdinus TaxID=2585196 RepID=A0A7K0CKA6_9ACTN|nr:hypothetical protein [Streptomyces smaragdinus]MQY13917.1 hypothetical protein [Streptomyces smaragdinus]